MSGLAGETGHVTERGCEECNDAVAVTERRFNGATLVRLCQGCADHWDANGLDTAASDDPKARCYLCGEVRPKSDTEVTRHRVPSARPGGTVQGVNRYVRMCRSGFGCKGVTDG